MKKSIERSTDRLVIRALNLKDYSTWKATHSSLFSPKNKWDLKPRAIKDLTLKSYSKFLKKQKNQRDTDKFYDFGIFKKNDNTFIGQVSIMEVARGISHTAFLGYKLFNTHWGKGYAKEAVSCVIEIGFKEIKLHRIEAGIEPDNKRSIGLAKSLKMRYEGRKKRSLYLRGKWVDLLMYTLTCEDLGLKFQGPKLQKHARV